MLPLSPPPTRRLVEDLWRIDVNRLTRVGIHRARVHGLLIQVEARSCSDLVDDGAFLTLSLPGLPTASKTWRLVAVSQARSGVPDFDRSCSWWAKAPRRDVARLSIVPGAFTHPRHSLIGQRLRFQVGKFVVCC